MCPMHILKACQACRVTNWDCMGSLDQAMDRHWQATCGCWSILLAPNSSAGSAGPRCLCFMQICCAAFGLRSTLAGAGNAACPAADRGHCADQGGDAQALLDDGNTVPGTEWRLLPRPADQDSAKRCCSDGLHRVSHQPGVPGTMRFGSTTKVLAKCMLKYYRISECLGRDDHRLGKPAVLSWCRPQQAAP